MKTDKWYHKVTMVCSTTGSVGEGKSVRDYIREMREYVGHRPVLLVGACVMVLDDQGRLLLEHRMDNHTWGLPGGAHEPGETVEESARRELFEETGLVCGDLSLFGVYSGPELFYEYPNGDQVHNVTLAYLCRAYRGTLAVSGESHEVKFFALSELPGEEDISPPVRPLLRDIKEWMQTDQKPTQLARASIDVELESVAEEDKTVLQHLLELCRHDYSEFDGNAVDPHGLFGYKYLDHYWTEAGRYPYFIKVSGQIAGFALIREMSERTATDPPYSVAEFFVLRGYRRGGVGKAAAQQLFDRFSPRRWIVGTIAQNTQARQFWRNVIGAYTRGTYEESENENYHVLEFTS